MKRIKTLKLFLLGGILLTIILPSTVYAFDISTFTNMPVEGDFVLGPGKIELYLSPGESVVRNLKITNRSGRNLNVKMEIEDFTGDNNISTKLLGEEKGVFSLKDFIKPERESFSLAHGERATMPITISIPETAEPGGLYGATIVRAVPEKSKSEEEEEQINGQIAIVPRLATLFFIRVRGDVNESGYLKSFSSNKKIYNNGPIDFSIIYQNDGSVHLDPYADIEIKNILGKTVDKLDVYPWFVMPGFSRDRIISWDKSFGLGRYTANISLNRGYGEISDEAKVSFWIIPIKAIAIGFSIIIFFALFIFWFSNKFELKKKPRKIKS